MLNKLIAGVIVELTPYIPSAIAQLSKGISELYNEWIEDEPNYDLIKEMSDDEIQLKKK